MFLDYVSAHELFTKISQRIVCSVHLDDTSAYYTGKVELLNELFIWIGEHIINDNVTYFVFARPCVFEFEYSSLKPYKSAPAEVPITPLPQRHHRLSTRGNMKDKVKWSISRISA
jgi:hypothetical protein